MGLSVAIVAMNEEANLGRTLASVRWADEIIVVDSGSTDRTCEIAREYGATVIHEPWRGYVAQKNYALEFCTQDWILALDADEEISPGLSDEIRKVVLGNGQFDGYSIPRQNLFLGKWMRHGGFYPDPKLRLFRRGDGYSTGFDPHDHYELHTQGPVKQFRYPMVHHTYPTLTLYLEHMNRYSSLGARMAVGKGHRSFSVIDIVLRPLATFIYNYFLRFGFLDGREGLLLHLYHAGYVSWKYSKAFELARQEKSR
ncbi:MAG: glycosyltransferase family 2 protein [Terriglobales bacterium]